MHHAPYLHASVRSNEYALHCTYSSPSIMEAIFGVKGGKGAELTAMSEDSNEGDARSSSSAKRSGKGGNGNSGSASSSASGSSRSAMASSGSATGTGTSGSNLCKY
jgi:hypothetical protein